MREKENERVIYYFLIYGTSNTLIVKPAKHASFGITIPDEAQLTLANPIDACIDLIDGEYLKDRAVLVRRGSCPFNSKIRRLQNVGARLVVMVDNESPSVLDRIGATTEQLNEFYLPVLMITKEVGGQIERVVRDKEVREGGGLGASEARKLVTQPRTGVYHHRTPPLLDQPWSRL